MFETLKLALHKVVDPVVSFQDQKYSSFQSVLFNRSSVVLSLQQFIILARNRNTEQFVGNALLNRLRSIDYEFWTRWRLRAETISFILGGVYFKTEIQSV